MRTTPTPEAQAAAPSAKLHTCHCDNDSGLHHKRKGAGGGAAGTDTEEGLCLGSSVFAAPRLFLTLPCPVAGL